MRMVPREIASPETRQTRRMGEMMTHADLVDLFYAALSAHPTEEEAYKDTEYVVEEALALGFTVDQVLDAYLEAEQG